MAERTMDPAVWNRMRGWLFFKVDKPSEAAERVSKLFTQGGEWWVVIRADVVDGSDFNLVVPVDSAKGTWTDAVEQVQKAVGQGRVDKAYIARVVESHPEIPHKAHCFITEEEHKQFGLKEYDPPGRHPKSPGANPWG